MNQLESLSAEKPQNIRLKTVLRGQYEGDRDAYAYVKNYSHRNNRLPLKRDARVVLNSGVDELKGNSKL